MPRRKVPGTKRVPKRSAKQATLVHDWLEKQSNKELINLILGMTQEYPRVNELLLSHANIKQGNIKSVKKAIHRDIEALVPDWGDGEVFDADSRFSHIAEQLTVLLEAGHADDVVELGKTFLHEAPNCYEYTHDDDWGISSGILKCLDIILEALSHSSLSPAEQLLWYIDAVLEDQYDTLDGTENFINKRCYKKSDWLIVSENLNKRLISQRKPGDNARFSTRYEREMLSAWLQTAMENSGHKTDIIDLLLQEAPITHNYDKLVSALLANGRDQEAQEWIIKGFAKTIDKLPGIAWQLVDQKISLARQKKHHSDIASLLSLKFFYRPNTMLYREQEKVAKRIHCWPAVQKALLTYLETGKRPDLPGSKNQKTATPSSSWPLPPCGLLLPKSNRATSFPDTQNLIDIAIYEKRPNDVLKWFYLGKKSRIPYDEDDSVAEAVKHTHPDEALAIWRRRAEGEISKVKPAAYKVAASYLIKMRTLYRKQKKTDEWRRYFLSLKQQNKARRRLIETLDSL